MVGYLLYLAPVRVIKFHFRIVKMKILKRTLILCFLLLAIASAGAQSQEKPLRIFGYFQSSFQHWTTFVFLDEGVKRERPRQNSFSLQQLNLFFQKDLGTNWTAFFNFEFLNNFSSSRQWGSFNLEEAWVKYRANMTFNLKLGLLIPIFNNLHVIKNRTPLLPYIIRPLAYETSFGEFIPIEVLTPVRAFAQVYGFFPAGEAKFTYAVYVGNSPNINNDPGIGQTGIDTTSTFLFGGRLGFRYGELKLGLSTTYDKDNLAVSLADTLGIPRTRLNELPKIRIGGDLSYNFANFSFESEFIKVNLEEDIQEIGLDLDFYYATLGYHVTEQLLIYGSYWFLDSHKTLLYPGNKTIEDEEIQVFTLGVSHDLTDTIRLKAQFSRIKSDEELQRLSQGVVITHSDDFSVFGLAASVFF